MWSFMFLLASFICFFLAWFFPSSSFSVFFHLLAACFLAGWLVYIFTGKVWSFMFLLASFICFFLSFLFIFTKECYFFQSLGAGFFFVWIILVVWYIMYIFFFKDKEDYMWSYMFLLASFICFFLSFLFIFTKECYFFQSLGAGFFFVWIILVVWYIMYIFFFKGKDKED